MYRRVIPICMGRSIERQDANTLKEAFQIIFKSGRRPIRLQTDKGIHQPSISKVSQGTRRTLLYHFQRGNQNQYR